ncbi:Lrp/AsnC family transcriptional regulator [Candidatus Woesearchaeota archaeon]|nr:Lrp/AsnC family transcriptional regulator [Candidatus Woesearchaeota archaeon]
MKDIRAKIIALLSTGNCTPQISQLAKKLKEPASTIHYNIKRLEHEGIIKIYKAVYNYKLIDKGHCTYLLAHLNEKQYSNPEETAQKISEFSEVESVDIITGEYELIIKLRTKDIDEYYTFIKRVIKQYGITKTVSMTSLNQAKTEFVKMD